LLPGASSPRTRFPLPPQLLRTATTRISPLIVGAMMHEAEGRGPGLRAASRPQVKALPGRPKTDPLTELTAAVDQVSGRAGVLVASVAGHEHRRRWTAGSVPACGAAARVAGVDRGCVRAVPAGRC